MRRALLGRACPAVARSNVARAHIGRQARRAQLVRSAALMNQADRRIAHHCWCLISQVKSVERTRVNVLWERHTPDSAGNLRHA